MRDPEFVAEIEAFEPEYQRMRMKVCKRRKSMNSEVCTKPSSLIALANDLREMQEETIEALEVLLGPQPVADSENEKPCGSLIELRSLLVEILGNSKNILVKAKCISNII